MVEPNPLKIDSLLSAMRERRVAVVGDVMLDCYLHGSLDRISPEAPVPVVEIARQTYQLGGAANVAACLSALGARVQLAGLVGHDEAGERLLRDARQAGIDVDLVCSDPRRPTTCKTRVVARNQQLLRLDRESREPLSGDLERVFLDGLRSSVEWAEAVVLSDYAKGVLTSPVCSAVLRAAQEKPVVVDPKRLPWRQYRGATVLKPNRSEAEQFAQFPIADDPSAARAAEEIASSLEVRHVLITRGSAGMTLASRDAAADRVTTHHLTSQRHELVDVTGAGDVVAATLATAMAAGASAWEAAQLANVAAGVKVGKFGAASVTPEEILDAAGHGRTSSAQKIMSLHEAASLVRARQTQGQRVVFTNGCFDLLHMGHVTCLERAKQLGDVLIVGLNSDASVRRLKGSRRPVQKQADRAQIIASQASVDAVVLFDEDTPLELIRAIRPDVLAKGADYARREAIAGWDLVESWGGSVVLIDLVEGRSTTRILQDAA